MNWRAPWLKDRSLPLLLVVIDVIVIAGVYAGVSQARAGEWDLPGNGEVYAICAWIFASYILGRYGNTTRGDRKRLAVESMAQSFVASSVICVSLIIHSWMYQIVDAQTRFRGFLLPALAIIGLLGVVTRLLVLGVDRKRNKKWLLVCSEREKKILTNDLHNWGHSGSEFCNLERLQKIDMRNTRVSIALGDDLSSEDVDYLYLAKLRASGCRVVGLRDWCESMLQRVPSELVDEKWFLLSEGFAVQPGRISWRIKRVGDVILGLALGVASIPIVLLAGAAIWINDKGPIFYGQVRTGIYGTKIKIWKLRSMSVSAEKGGARWATKNDSRVTRVGRVIRKSRIDELPQLWSVLVGDLSLIGPRPERPEIEIRLEQCIENYRTREWIRPGLSGWAQVSYPYGASVEDTKMKLSYDLYYLKNAGLLLDFLILLKTIKLVLRGEGSKPES